MRHYQNWMGCQWHCKLSRGLESFGSQTHAWCQPDYIRHELQSHSWKRKRGLLKSSNRPSLWLLLGPARLISPFIRRARSPVVRRAGKAKEAQSSKPAGSLQWRVVWEGGLRHALKNLLIESFGIVLEGWDTTHDPARLCTPWISVWPRLAQLFASTCLPLGMRVHTKV